MQNGTFFTAKRNRNTNLLFFLFLLFFGCNSVDKDWAETHKINSLESYKEFLIKHPDSEYTLQCNHSIDSLEWIDASSPLDTNKINNYIETYKNGKYLSIAQEMIDSIRWKTIANTKDIKKIENYMVSNPDSKYLDEANDMIWALRWPPVKVKEASFVLIYKNGEAPMYSSTTLSMGLSYTVGSDADLQTTGNQVIIWRNFSKKEISKYKKIDLRPGIAYLKTGDGFKFIKKVDLNKSDLQLCKEFGVSAN